MPVMPRIMIVPPFTTRIMNEPLPVNFNTTTMKKFDGVRDPHEKIMGYQAVMMLMGANDAVMCKAFFSTLGGITQR